jgi:hypothetical protein
MGFWHQLKYVVVEGSGARAGLKILSIVLCNDKKHPMRLKYIKILMVCLLSSFNENAEIVVDKFGPAWSKFRAKGLSLGCWTLLLIWVIPLLISIIMIFISTI